MKNSVKATAATLILVMAVNAFTGCGNKAHSENSSPAASIEEQRNSSQNSALETEISSANSELHDITVNTKIKCMAWIYTNLIASHDSNIRASRRSKLVEEYDWTETLLDRLDYISDSGIFTSMIDFKNSFRIDSMNGVSEDCIGNLISMSYLFGIDYDEVIKDNVWYVNSWVDWVNTPQE